MLFKNYQMFFLMFLVLGTSIAVSSNSWFTCWVGLEINLMSLIPLILSELNFKSTEASIKYFLSQAMASVILISSSCFETLFEMNFYITNFSTMIFISLAIKSGLAPFHLWFPQVMSCISWFKCAIILTWQKIAPFILMSCFLNKKILYLLVVAAAVIGAMGGLNQTDSKLLLTYSSIAHSSWMLMMTFFSVTLWGSYFSMYVFILLPIISSFFKLNLNKITEIYKTKISPMNKNMMIFMILSLGGLPPFLGFTAKLMAILLSIKMFPLMILIIMVSSSLVSLFYYTKMFYNMSLTTKNLVKMNFTSETDTSNKLMVASSMGNVLMSLMVLLI